MDASISAADPSKSPRSRSKDEVHTWNPALFK